MTHFSPNAINLLNQDKINIFQIVTKQKYHILTYRILALTLYFDSLLLRLRTPRLTLEPTGAQPPAHIYIYIYIYRLYYHYLFVNFFIYAKCI